MKESDLIKSILGSGGVDVVLYDGSNFPVKTVSEVNHFAIGTFQYTEVRRTASLILKSQSGDKFLYKPLVDCLLNVSAPKPLPFSFILRKGEAFEFVKQNFKDYGIQVPDNVSWMGLYSETLEEIKLGQESMDHKSTPYVILN